MREIVKNAMNTLEQNSMVNSSLKSQYINLCPETEKNLSLVAGETVQCVIARAALQKTRGQVSSQGSLLPIIPAAGDWSPSSGLHGNCTHMYKPTHTVI